MIDTDYDFKNNVLKNKLNITNTEDLKQAEADIVSIKIREYEERNDFEISEEYFKNIHKSLFEEIYDFAGTYRKVNIEKQELTLNGFHVHYADYQNIELNIETVMSEIRAKNISGLSNDEFCYFITDITTKLWKTHPFREGNTRCVIIFLCKYLAHLNFGFNNQTFKENACYVRNALVAASYEDVEIDIYANNKYLLEFMKEAIKTPLCNLKV